MYLEEGQIHLVPASANTGGGDIRDVGLYGPIVRDIGMGPCRPWEHRKWGVMGVTLCVISSAPIDSCVSPFLSLPVIRDDG